MTLFIIITCLGLVGSAIFSGFENGILAVRRARLDHAIQEGSRPAKAIDWFLSHPAAMLGTILLGNNLCNCFAAIYYDEIIVQLTQNWATASQHLPVLISLCSSAMLTLIVLICAEITPKVFFRERPFSRVRLVVIPIFVFYVMVYPIVKLLTWLSEGLNRLVTKGSHRHSSEVALMREDFRMMLIESEEAGYLDKEARTLLDNSLDYHHQHVEGIMTPLSEVTTVDTSCTLAEALAMAADTNSSRFPVVDGEESQGWAGIFSIYDAIYQRPADRWDIETVGEHMRPLITIDAGSGVHQVLPRSRQFRSPLLAVIDNNGKPLGVVSASDVIAPLFGELNS